jgi:hypothetical protein
MFSCIPGGRVSALINLKVADYYERGGTRWLRFQENEGKNTKFRCTRRLKKQSIFGLNARVWPRIRVLTFPSFGKNRDAWIEVS